MRVDKMLESNYLKVADIDGDTIVTVDSLKKVNVARGDETPEYKWTVKFKEFDKPLVMNKTNIKRAQKALGDDTDDWLGKTIIIYVDDNVQYGADIVEGLRLRAERKAQPATPRQAGDDFSDDPLPF